ncbi:MAG: hypothetical protein ACI81T_003100, partial [Bacteroidia bacterium]
NFPNKSTLPEAETLSLLISLLSNNQSIVASC